MRRGVLAVVAVLAVVLAISSCGCPDDKSVTRPALAGQYFLGADPGTCSDAPVSRAPADSEQHQLTLAPDRTTVTETFIRNGKTYVVAYDVVSIEWSSL